MHPPNPRANDSRSSHTHFHTHPASWQGADKCCFLWDPACITHRGGVCRRLRSRAHPPRPPLTTDPWPAAAAGCGAWPGTGAAAAPPANV
eukprot:1159118-Pelagomonas_calceolata.AAC.11